MLAKTFFIFNIFWSMICFAGAVNQEALELYPELRGLKILFVRHQPPPKGIFLDTLGIPNSHRSHSSFKRDVYDCEIVLLDLDTGATKTIFKPKGNFFVGHVDLHWDGGRFLFAKTDKDHWQVYEMFLQGGGIRQVSRTPTDVDCYEPIYLPSGDILVASNAAYQCVPCWHGQADRYVANLYVMKNDGSDMRRVCFDQDHDSNPVVCNNGRVLYTRWDYTGMNRVFNRPLMMMNPDGTSQRAIYGSNSWFPNGLFSARELPGRHGQFLCILTGYHGSNQNGQLVILDTNKGYREAEGIVQRISGEGKKIDVQIRDAYGVHDFPHFLTPYPITDRVFLTSLWKSAKQRETGIYVADRKDRVVPLYLEKNVALVEPIPVMQRKKPATIPERIQKDSTEAILYIQDVYMGEGLKGVPRDVIKSLRVIAYDFGYSGLAGVDKIGTTGPWDAMRIVGTTPVETDGSAVFEVPANTPIAIQTLDKEGKAVQLMRSWLTAMPGEVLSCVGCHENPDATAVMRTTIASLRKPKALEAWYGPQRGFDFEREVQPVLNQHCVSCHDGSEAKPDLRSETYFPNYQGRSVSSYDTNRMHKKHKKLYAGKVKFTPSYDALIDYIRRVGAGDCVDILTPGHYHADTSPLIQMLQAGHQGVKLEEEAWHRLITWIDLNGPCHGTWRDVFDMDIPDGQYERRNELIELYGGPAVNPEFVPVTPSYNVSPVRIEKTDIEEHAKPEVMALMDREKWVSEFKTIQLENGLSLKFVKIPAERPFWISVSEISNAQYRCFEPDHHSGYFRRHVERADDKGMSLNQPDQPALKVSWEQANAFCQWLSNRAGVKAMLPSVKQWNTACLSGSDTLFFYGSKEDDFSRFANMADKTFATIGYKGKRKKYFVVATDIEQIVSEGVKFADSRFADGGCVTVGVDTYTTNKLGVRNMHGNAAEWTTGEKEGEKIVKGGSFLDRPERCSADRQYTYPAWQRVHNVGFRVVLE